MISFLMYQKFSFPSPLAFHTSTPGSDTLAARWMYKQRGELTYGILFITVGSWEEVASLHTVWMHNGELAPREPFSLLNPRPHPAKILTFLRYLAYFTFVLWGRRMWKDNWILDILSSIYCHNISDYELAIILRSKRISSCGLCCCE